jgi:hypothetical protein
MTGLAFAVADDCPIGAVVTVASFAFGVIAKPDLET